MKTTKQVTTFKNMYVALDALSNAERRYGKSRVSLTSNAQFCVHRINVRYTLTVRA
jgi:hypothetical protein